MTKQSTIKIILIAILIAIIGVATWLVLSSANDETEPADTETVQTETESTPPDSTPGEDTELLNEYRSEKGTPIIVAEPQSGETVSSPLTIAGTVPGSWSFEASFPVKLLDADRQELGTTPATLQGDWMTDEQVPFTATLDDFTTPSTDTGYLVLENANPSGLEENADRLEIPVRF